MTLAVVLDSHPLSLLANPKASVQVVASHEWASRLHAAGCRLIIAEIADYEVRRELIRANKAKGLKGLDALIDRLEYVPLDTAAIRLAAALWAQARRAGRPTAPDHALDADVILASQALSLGEPEVVVATSNIGHLRQFVRAELWHDIQP